MRLVYNSNSTMHLPVLMQVRIARETGWDGIFIREEHVRRYLAQGYPVASLREALAGLEPVNMGALRDVERSRPPERADMLREATALTDLAIELGVTNVQVLTGPVVPGGAYSGPGELSEPELRRITAEAIRTVADLGAADGVSYYLEPVAWTPLGTLAGAVAAVEAAERDNVKVLLDFWHLWQRGTTPDEVARLDPRIIAGVDFGDSLGPPGPRASPGSPGSTGSVDPNQRSRCVWPGDGAIPLREWVAAVRSTGFDGWWDNELYSPEHWELADPFAIGAGLLSVLRDFLVEG